MVSLAILEFTSSPNLGHVEDCDFYKFLPLCSLAGMLEKVGLLPAFNNQQIPFAYEIYIADDKAGFAQSSKFKYTFGNKVKIEFMGLWCVFLLIIFSYSPHFKR